MQERIPETGLLRLFDENGLPYQRVEHPGLHLRPGRAAALCLAGQPRAPAERRGGAVTLLGLVNEREHEVELWVDAEVRNDVAYASPLAL
ncbi:MAG TPA: hypothetical protein VMT46_11680 [Anaerolineaceae bacterium]|nr:hypothetical protein [Anaerolineaceae bacterium]